MPDEQMLPAHTPTPADPTALSVALEALRASHKEIYEALVAERERYLNLFERAPDAYVVTDADGIISEVNLAAESLLRTGRSALRGKPLALYLAGAAEHVRILSHASAPQVLIAAVVRPRGSEPVPVEARLTHADAPYSDNAIAWILRDVSDQRSSEDATQHLAREEAHRAMSERAERRAQFVADISRILAESRDYHLTLSIVARHCVPFLAEVCTIDIFDGEPPERIAVAHADPAHAQLARELRSVAPDAEQCGAAVDFVSDARASDELGRDAVGNRILWAMGVRSVLCVPLVADGMSLGTLLLGSPGNLHDIRALAEDVAHRMALAVQQSRLLQQAQAASQAKSHFISVISHEFRTPLTSIIGFTEILMMGDLEERQREQLARVQSSAWHLVGLIDEILTFARTEAGRETVTIQSQDIADLVRRTVAIIEPLAQPKGVSVEVSIEPGDWWLGTDGGKLRQILFNLLTNAIKFTEQGSVRVALARSAGEIECSVSDTGIGIAEEHLEKIFEPFWQVDQSNTRPYGGTGLGLSVTRRLARLLDGDITVTSGAGSGSAFVLRLPAHLPAEEVKEG